MSETRTRERGQDPGPAPVAQWVGLFLAPAVFAVHLVIAYPLVRWACLRRADLWLHVVDLLAIALAALGALVAWRVWTRVGREEYGDVGRALPRTRFLGVTGVGFSGLMTLVLFAQWVGGFFIATCQ